MVIYGLATCRYLCNTNAVLLGGRDGTAPNVRAQPDYQFLVARHRYLSQHHPVLAAPSPPKHAAGQGPKPIYLIPTWGTKEELARCDVVGVSGIGVKIQYKNYVFVNS